MAVKTYIVTVPGGTGGGYYIDGVQKPTLDLAKGATYRFDVSDASNSVHPFRFSTNANNSPSSPYTTGVTTSGTQGNPGAYVEIDLTSTSTDTLYYYCTNHSGMGGQLNLTADSWGALSWNVGSWGEQDNVTEILTGFSLSSNLNSVSIDNQINIGWGGQVWGNGEWGELFSPEVIPTGISLSADLGTPSITADVNVGWSAKTWGYPAGGGWGNLYDVNQPLTGFNLTSTLGEETVIGQINAGWGRSTWGENGWGIQGTLLLSGIQMSANIGSVSIDNQINIGWGSDTWGYETWGASGLLVPLTGIELSSNIDSVSFNISGKAEPTGQELTITQGDAEGYIDFREIVTGFSLPMTLQYSEVVINAIGFGLTMQEGDETSDANTIATVSATSASTWNGNFAWGYGVYGNQPVTTLAMSMQEGNVDPAPDAMVTGNAAAMFVGDETVTGDANTGTITNINWGEQAWGESTWGNGTYFDATGYAQAATINLGTVVADANTIASITGQLMTMQEGDEGTTANARINVTGINLTFSVGTVYNLIWNEVNTGTTSIWTEVDTAA
jgi:hypothetical protein